MVKQAQTREARLVSYITPATKKALERKARELGVSVSTVVVLAVQAYLGEKGER